MFPTTAKIMIYFRLGSRILIVGRQRSFIFWWCDCTYTYDVIINGRVFDDVSLHEKLSNIGYSFLGLLVSMLPPRSSVNAELKLTAALVQAMVLVLVLCPLAVEYCLGCTSPQESRCGD